jgi:EAL domain-containing protein (putative c-di-GMP-specific phosphodiesterase class I)
MRIITREPEAHLIELLHLVQENPQGWQSISFGFSRLLEHYRSEYQIKIATNLMNDLLGERDGAIYLCEDATIFVMVRHFPKPLLDKLVFQLRYLFMDDPLAYTMEGEENPEFAVIYDIESQWQDFMDICKRRLVSRVRKTQAEQRTISGATSAAMESVGMSHKPVARAPMKLFNASNLASIERDVKDVDLSAAIRRQPVCAAIPDTTMRTVFDEMYINISHLRQSMGIEVDLLSNRWLFKYLTQILDNQMLDMIQRNPARFLANPVSLNLNIATLLSNRFAEFDAAIKPSSKVSVVIELQIADVFADMGAFLAAKDTVQKLGYRVCLDGVTELSFPQIDRQRLGFDLIKLIWNADSAKDVSSENNRKLLEAIKSCGANRVILTRCDTRQAVEYGQAMGLTLFQGRYLDSIVNPKAALQN